MSKPYQPKTGAPCHCKSGGQRDNCVDCEGTGMRIDFAAIRSMNKIQIGNLTVKSMPGTPMTQAEMEAQCRLVSSVAHCDPGEANE